MGAAEDARACPQCGSPLTSDPRFVVWCVSCDWNVEPLAKPEAPGRVERWAGRLAERNATAVFNQVKQYLSLRPHWDVLRVLSYLVALGVHAITLTLFAVAAVIAVAAHGSLVGYVIAA